MKSLVAVAAFVGLVAAQLPASLPDCGKTCINNMLALAPQLGCPPKNGQPDAVCLCSNVDFGYGIRDCVNESCPAGTNTTSIIAYGVSYCNAALASASASAITTKPIVSTEKGGSKTTIGSTTIYSSITAAAGSAGSSTGSEASSTGSEASSKTSEASSNASEASSKSASASSVASSAEASASSVASSAASAASSVAASASSAASSAASGGASSASGGASSASSAAGAMPMVTVAAQAFVGMAGLAAAFAL